MSRHPGARGPAALLVLATLALAAPAAASASPITGLSWVIAMSPRLSMHLGTNCTVPTGLTWPYAGPRHPHQNFYGTPPGFDTASGPFDPVTRRGLVAGKGEAIIFDSVFSSQGSGGHPFKLVDMGVETARGRVFLTGRILATRTRSAAAGRRQRLAVIANPHYTEGQVTGKVASSLQFTVTGNAAIAKPFAAALSRARCTSKRFAGRGSGPIRAGTQLGRVTVALLPGTAVGLAGQSFLESPGFRLQSDDGTAVGVTPAGGAATARVAGQSYLRFDVAPGARTPLACEFGSSCVPSGGGFGLVGGVTLSLNGRTAEVGALAVSYPGPSITGTLNGSPVTITTGGVNFTDDFLARTGAALGATLNGLVLPIVTRFTRTAAG